MLFGVTGEGLGLPVGGQRLIAFSTLLARRLILLKWKDVTPPTVSHWVKDVLYHLKLEKIRFVLRGSENKFHQVWGPFLTFSTNHQQRYKSDFQLFFFLFFSLISS